MLDIQNSQYWILNTGYSDIEEDFFFVLEIDSYVTKVNQQIDLNKEQNMTDQYNRVV